MRKLVLILVFISVAAIVRAQIRPGAAAAGNTRQDKMAQVIRKLRPTFMLGIGSGPGDKWIEETRAQGAKWDMRYQYICGGVNTPSNWKTWNQPAGAFALWYMQASDDMGCIPVLTYYQMCQSLPGKDKGKGEADACAVNCRNADTMKAYFEDFKLLLEKAKEFRKPVIIHHDPDLWGFMWWAKEFAPNDADRIEVKVKSSKFPDAAKFPDNAVGFAQTLAAMRDKYAPNVLLGWHASKWGEPDARKMCKFIRDCGDWDIIFTDPSDRDCGWRENRNGKGNGGWWENKDFKSFRDWSGRLHEGTGLPIIAWQIPMGNQIMATCNNTEGHFMDNRAEYFLEDYPKNRNIQEWADAGYVALLFGVAGGGCTSVGDNMKDGITNPKPIKGNKGEKAKFPDDDGGYLRLRGGEYYKKGPVKLEKKGSAIAETTNENNRARE